MRRPSRRATLEVEAIERRSLLSGVTSVLTSRTYDTVVAAVERVVSNLKRTHNTARAMAQLSALSERIPFESQQLAAAWASDLASYDPAVRGSGRATEKSLMADLSEDVAAGVAAHALQVTGRHARMFSGAGPGAPASSLDSVRVANHTSLTLAVTVTLNNTGRSIPKTIPGNGASALFDFGTATGNFMSINIRNANGASPPPYTNGLNRPIGGYRGTLFSVSIFAGRFSLGI
jgi:hypothetical protein